MRPRLVRWQWDGYPEFHQDRWNLLLHLVAVPWFVLSTLGVVAALSTAAWLAAGGAALSSLVAFGIQAVGHKREANPAIPFDGIADAVGRIFAEQFINFPRFVFSGGWRTALLRSSKKDDGEAT